MIEVALVGVGYWGPNLANSIERTTIGRLRWLCDLNRANAETLAQRWPHAQVSDRLDPILADAKVDAVVLATPTNTHYQLVKRCLQAGKHVLVEKPLTTHSGEAEELTRLAGEAGRILMVGHVFEYNASIRAVSDLIRSGELGDLHYMSFERTNLGPVRTDVSALWDLATHDVSIMCDFVGAAPIEVSARGQSYLNKGLDDVVFATFAFPGGIVAHLHASWLNPRKVRQITVVGSKKMVLWDDLDLRHPIRIYDKRVSLPPLSEITGSFLEYKTLVVDGGVSTPPVTSNEPLLSECRHFLECVRDLREPRSGGASGLRVVLALEAAERSMRSGSTVTPVAPAATDRPR